MYHGQFETTEWHETQFLSSQSSGIKVNSVKKVPDDLEMVQISLNLYSYRMALHRVKFRQLKTIEPCPNTGDNLTSSFQ